MPNSTKPQGATEFDAHPIHERRADRRVGNNSDSTIQRCMNSDSLTDAKFLAPRKHDNLAQQAGPADAGGTEKKIRQDRGTKSRISRTAMN